MTSTFAIWPLDTSYYLDINLFVQSYEISNVGRREVGELSHFNRNVVKRPDPVETTRGRQGNEKNCKISTFMLSEVIKPKHGSLKIFGSSFSN